MTTCKPATADEKEEEKSRTLFESLKKTLRGGETMGKSIEVEWREQK